MSVFGFGDLAFMGAVGGGERDPFFSNVSLLLHGDGANDSTSIIDSSPTPKTATAVGNAKISTVQSKFGGSSIVFDKVDDRLTFASDSAFAFDAGDFTIEAWIYSRDVGVQTRGWLQISPTPGGLQQSYTGGIAIFQGTNGSGGVQAGGICVAINGNNFLGSNGSTVVLFANQWQHIAVTRSGITCRIFVDGTLVGSRSLSANLTGSNLVIGGYYDTGYLYDGFIDELRITKGVARYVNNFTPPDAPFLDF